MTVYFFQHSQGTVGKNVIHWTQSYLLPHLYYTRCICQDVNKFMLVVLVDLSTWLKQWLHEEVQKGRYADLWRKRMKQKQKPWKQQSYRLYCWSIWMPPFVTRTHVRTGQWEMWKMGMCRLCLLLTKDKTGWLWFWGFAFFKKIS